LADGLARGLKIEEAAAWASRGAGAAVSRQGAQAAMPVRAELERGAG